jgi:hypothetical protein
MSQISLGTEAERLLGHAVKGKQWSKEKVLVFSFLSRDDCKLFCGHPKMRMRAALDHCLPLGIPAQKREKRYSDSA